MAVGAGCGRARTYHPPSALSSHRQGNVRLFPYGKRPYHLNQNPAEAGLGAFYFIAHLWPTIVQRESLPSRVFGCQSLSALRSIRMYMDQGVCCAPASIREKEMATSVKEMLAAANAVVPRVTHEEARKMISDGNALVVDVRDMPEIQASGKIKGALHVPRGMLEFRADADTPYHDKSFTKDRPIILYCASGGRSALSGKVLKDLGYENVHNLGAFKDWVESGGAVAK